MQRNDHLEDLLAVLNDSYCSPNAPLRERLNEAEKLYKNYNIHLLYQKEFGKYKNHVNQLFERMLRIRSGSAM